MLPSVHINDVGAPNWLISRLNIPACAYSSATLYDTERRTKILAPTTTRSASADAPSTICAAVPAHWDSASSLRSLRWREFLRKRRVTQLVRRQCLYAPRKRRFIHTTDFKHKLPIAPNLLARNFAAQAPNRVWVTDITCVWTLQGWLFLSVILDLFSRRLVGWEMSKNIDEGLILGALRMALLNRKPKAGLIHHSDRGSVYCGLS